MDLSSIACAVGIGGMGHARGAMRSAGKSPTVCLPQSRAWRGTGDLKSPFRFVKMPGR